MDESKQWCLTALEVSARDLDLSEVPESAQIVREAEALIKAQAERIRGLEAGYTQVGVLMRVTAGALKRSLRVVEDSERDAEALTADYVECARKYAELTLKNAALLVKVRELEAITTTQLTDDSVPSMSEAERKTLRDKGCDKEAEATP